MLVPIYGFLEGDTIGLLILAHDTMRIGEVATKLESMASIRAPAAGTPVVVHRGRRLDASMTVTEAGIDALDRIDVRDGTGGDARNRDSRQEPTDV